MITYISHKIQRLSRVLAWVFLVMLVYKVSKFIYTFIKDYQWDTAASKIVGEFEKSAKRILNEFNEKKEGPGI